MRRNLESEWKKAVLLILVWLVFSMPATAASDPPDDSMAADSTADMKSSRKTSSEAGHLYRIGPEDILHISVWANEELTGDVVVRPDGNISLPLIRDVRAEGLTTTELASVIEERLRAFIKVPQVYIVVKNINSPKIYILGNVARQGPISLRGDITVLQALSMAGGFSQFASPKKIKIVRNNGGKQEILTVNYYEMIDGGEGNYLLRPGDTIVVP